MPGGVIQLVAIGSQDLYLTGNPSFSYFKAVHRQHTNFAMESIRIEFNTKPTLLDTSRTSVTCTIPRYADLLKELYFSFQLPDIYSDDSLRFQWVENVAHYMIDRYYISLDEQVLDLKYGEWLDVWNELTIPLSKRSIYNKMTGNVEEFTAPRALEDRVIIENNNISYQYYPNGDRTTSTPSIKGRRFYLPLQFWFSQNPALALPLIALQYQTVTITVEFRSLNELYQVWNGVNGTPIYLSPLYYNQLNQDYNQSSIGFSTFSLNNTSYVDLQGYIEANYVFLDTSERNAIAQSAYTSLLVERIERLEFDGILANSTVNLLLHNSAKEIVFFARRDDFKNYNDWTNFTNRHPTNESYEILSSAQLIFNGITRLEQKDSTYFNLLQPWQHHTNTPRTGLYVYSFALYPEKYHPSGTCNMSMVNNVQMQLANNAPVSTTYQYSYIFYSIAYNIFEIASGMGKMKYQ